MKRTSLVVVALLGWSPVAAAQSEAEPAAPPEGAAPAEAVAPVPAPPLQPDVAPMAPPRKLPRVTVMWAPLRTIIPLLEFTFEYRVMPKLGISLTLGAGTRTLETAGTEVSGREIEVGGQVRYYVLGDFRHGMQLGVEALEEYVKFDDLPAGVGAAAGGFTVGPFLGYKVATGLGFTFEAQLGARYVVIEPEAQGGVGSPGFSEEEKWLPLLHLNIGWSF